MTSRGEAGFRNEGVGAWGGVGGGKESEVGILAEIPGGFV